MCDVNTLFAQIKIGDSSMLELAEMQIGNVSKKK
jgi:hypothetical protein